MSKIASDLVERLGRISGPAAVGDLSLDDLLTLDETLGVLGYLDAGQSHDAETVAEATSRLRSDSGLGADDVVEPVLVVHLINLVTTEVMEDAADKAAVESYPLLKRGRRGDWVEYAQNCLLAAEFDVGPTGADAIFGPRTEAAVRAYQTARGLDVDGKIGDDTWAAFEAGGGATSRAEPDEVCEPDEAASETSSAESTVVDFRYLASLSDEDAGNYIASLVSSGKKIGTAAEIATIFLEHVHEYYEARAVLAAGTIAEVAPAATAARLAIMIRITSALSIIGWACALITIYSEVFDAFGSHRRAVARQGLVYGMMWEALGRPDGDKGFADWPFLSAAEGREAFFEGVREGRAKVAGDAEAYNVLNFAVAAEMVTRDMDEDGGAMMVLNAIWNEMAPEAGILHWPEPADDTGFGGERLFKTRLPGEPVEPLYPDSM